MHLYIRADADGKIGTGHIMRCIALAQAWQDQGGEVAFISHCESGALKERIQREGFRLIALDNVCPDSSDLTNTLSILKNESVDQKKWLVLDGYHFTPEYQKSIHDEGYSVMVVDDINHLPYYHADILLNQNIHATDLTYNHDQDTTLLMGTKYVLLRREFLKYREFKRQIPDRARNILVTLGGADPDNVTLKVVEALKLLEEPDILVRIIIGPANPHHETLHKAIASAHFEVELLLNPPNMPELMAWADMAVSAGGSTCWELAFMGLPNLIMVIAGNQSGIAEELANLGAGINWGWHENITLKQYTQTLKEIVQDKDKRSCLSEQGQGLVDGKGRQRIIRAMLTGQIKLRRAQENECKLLWKGANDLEVRQSSLNSKDIAWEDYQTCSLNKQNETNCIKYIALSQYEVPIGQICFDIKDSMTEIGYSINKSFRGIGLGQMLLKKGIEQFCTQEENPITIRGCVKKENELSGRTFQDVGFLEAWERSIDENEVTSTLTNNLSITIISDKKSWINVYMPSLISECVLSGHTVTWEHNVSQIKKGDIAFYLGCGQIVPANILSRNKHNLVVHESALPQGKGWSPLTWQILEGKNEIPISLFEAEESVDSGKIFAQEMMYFNGTELVAELRQKQAEYTIKLCMSFVGDYPGIVLKGLDQSGESSYYKNRVPNDSILNPDKTIREQFNLLRIVDNERYPAYFELGGMRYVLKIEKG